MTEDVEKKILYLSRSIALMRDLTKHLSQGYTYDYGRENQRQLDELISKLDETVIHFDQLRDQYALDMVEQPEVVNLIRQKTGL